MPNLTPTISLTNATVEKMSRHDMLEWVNSTVNGQYKKIEELCSGVAYCQMMEMLFANSIGLKKMKCKAKLEHEFLHNLKLFQAAFTKINFDKSVPIERLIKGKFQDNFEFLQWFKKFFDSQSNGKENFKLPIAIPANSCKPVKKILKESSSSSIGAGPKNKSTLKADILKTPKRDKLQEEKTISPSSLCVLEELHQQLRNQVLNMQIQRDTIYKKLAGIEVLLKESLKNETYVEWCTYALDVLYADSGNSSTAH